MVGDKTGALLGAATRIGALIGGASDQDASKMAEYGMMLGLAFQIQDDWLDVFGDSMTFGKPIGGDINNNKKSYLLLSALQTGTPDAKALAEAMKLPAGEHEVVMTFRPRSLEVTNAIGIGSVIVVYLLCAAAIALAVVAALRGRRRDA